MNGNTLAAGDETDDRIRGRRLAAARKPCHQAIDANDENSAASAGGLALAWQNRVVDARCRDVGFRKRLNRCLHLTRVEFRTSHGCEKILELGEARLAGNRFKIERGHAGA